MKLVLTAVAAFALMGSATTFAQTMPPAGDPTPPAAPAMPGQPAPMSDAASPAAPPMAPEAPMAPAAPMAPSTTANTPGGDAPATYPPCTTKAQDRCVQGGKMMKAPMHKMHKMKSAKAAPATATDATMPAPQ